MVTTDIIEYGQKEKVISRKHYRFGCLWNISCQECPDTKEVLAATEEEKEWFQAATTDISGGGCRFNSSRQLEQDSVLIIKIKGSEKKKEKELLFKAKVIGSIPLPNRMGVYETRVKFIELSFCEQEQLIKWIFEEKRKFKWRERGLDHEEKYFNY